jgi:hypothetical protein
VSNHTASQDVGSGLAASLKFFRKANLVPPRANESGTYGWDLGIRILTDFNTSPLGDSYVF